ncbi:MAG: PAS domain S-box protein, partial [Poseidonibacter sp.]|uniref:PAS domain S-box protein n=1 Tax=Poseidonibacter sp. TaxID=2321188 RepID=UPI00359DDF03
MKKSIISAIFLIFLIFTLGYFINNAKLQRANYSLIEKSINNITLLNKDLDYYFKNSLAYDNFDIIQNKIKSFENELKKIKENKLLKDINNDELKNTIRNLESSIKFKFQTINKAKSHKAVLNNSYRIIQRLNNKRVSKNLNDLYTIIMTIDKNSSLDIKDEFEKMSNIDKLYTNKFDILFIKHSRVILEHQMKFNNLQNKLTKLNIDTLLKKFNILYDEYSQKSNKQAELSISILFILLFVAIVLYLYNEYKLNITNKKLSRFKDTLHNSNNIIVVTDKNETIKYVNKAFLKTTGYSLDEVLGKKTSILKSGQKSKEFYKKLKETIHSGKKWSGEFINKNKNGNLIYEKASITPVFDDKGAIIEFIAVKLDITKEILSQQQLKEQEKLLINQTKLASMGEMIANIAHQWRQPLSVISTGVTGMQLQKEYGLLTDEEFHKTCKFIDKNVQYLSNTIDDFRNFIKGDKIKTYFNLNNQINSFLHLIEGSCKTHNITIISDIPTDIEIEGFENELIQCLMNIYNNAKDALIQNDIKEKYIFI